MPSAREAMLSAGYARIRPVLMTATAMVLGMLPMSLGLGEGGEQNAPLGRAVIGGLMFATVTTLFVVPIIYSYLRTKPPVDHERQLNPKRKKLDEARHANWRRPPKNGCARRSKISSASCGSNKPEIFARRAVGQPVASVVDHALVHLSWSGGPPRGGFLGRLYSASETPERSSATWPSSKSRPCREWK